MLMLIVKRMALQATPQAIHIVYRPYNEYERDKQMSDSIIVAIITGSLALIGTVITCIFSQKKTEKNIEINQAVTTTKIDELTREVREHNGFARRMPVVEEQIKVINHRLNNLEEIKMEKTKLTKEMEEELSNGRGDDEDE